MSRAGTSRAARPGSVVRRRVGWLKPSALIGGEGDCRRSNARGGLTGVAEAVEGAPRHPRGGGEPERDEGIDQDCQHRELHFDRFDLLAEILRCAADRQSSDEDGDDRDEEEAVETARRRRRARCSR
jgi:hypothetical protein